MRNLKFKEFYKVATLLAIFVIFSSSCKKDDKVNPVSGGDYVGTWIAMDSISTNYGDTSVKDMMTLTETTFTDLLQILIPVNNWMDYLSMKGSISVSGNFLNVTITEVGAAFNLATKLPTGKMTIYKDGSPEFDTLLSQADQSKTFKSEFSVSGNKLTLKTDRNNDGDYLGNKETIVYTKQ